MRRILPNADARFCAWFIGSPPLPPSAKPDVEQARSRRSRWPCERIEREVAAVVIGERLLDADQLARRVAVVGGGRRVLRRPLEQHRVVRVRSAARA